MAGAASELEFGWEIRTLVQTDPHPMAILHLGLRQTHGSLCGHAGTSYWDGTEIVGKILLVHFQLVHLA